MLGDSILGGVWENSWAYRCESHTKLFHPISPNFCHKLHLYIYNWLEVIWGKQFLRSCDFANFEALLGWKSAFPILHHWNAIFSYCFKISQTVTEIGAYWKNYFGICFIVVSSKVFSNTPKNGGVSEHDQPSYSLSW